MDKIKFIRERFSPEFNLEYLFKRDKKVSFLIEAFKQYLEEVRRISEYIEFIRIRRNAAIKLIEFTTKESKAILNPNTDLEYFRQRLQAAQTNYGLFWSFDHLMKSHHLVVRAESRLIEITHNNGEEIALFLTPGKRHCKEGEFSLIKHINKTKIVRKYAKIYDDVIELSEFLNEVIYAEGKQDYEMKELYFYFDVFGMRYLQNLKKARILETNNPLEWLCLREAL